MLTSTWSRDANLSVFLGLLIVLLFFLLPWANFQTAADFSAGLIVALLLVSGSVAMIRHALVRRLVVLIALSAVLASWIGTITDSTALALAVAVLKALVLALLILLLLMDVYRPGPITRFRIAGAVAAYVLLGLIWSYVYAILEMAAPGSLHLPGSQGAQVGQPRVQAELLYFSLATLTTVGYGDIVPVAPFARSMAMLEAIAGQVFLATMIARLVSLRQPSPTRRPNDLPPGE